MKNSGFTLIELMVVVIIIAALAAMILPNVLPASEDAKIKIAQGGIASITTALELYKLHNDAFPSSEQGLNALIVKPAGARKWKGPYLKKRKVHDPWKQPYQYKVDGSRSLTGPDVWSKGPDGQDGTADDVWPEE